MKKSSILYENIRIEMARKDKTILDIAKTVNMNRDTLSKKLSGRSKLNLNETFAIQQTCFPDIDIRMLFKESCTNSYYSQPIVAGSQ